MRVRNVLARCVPLCAAAAAALLGSVTVGAGVAKAQAPNFFPAPNLDVTQPTDATDNVAPPSVDAATDAAASTLGTSTLMVPDFMLTVLQQTKRVPHYQLVPSSTIPPATIPGGEMDQDPVGFVGTYQPSGPTVTSANAFFKPLGTNGRTCFSCHQPASGMSISVPDLQNLSHYRGDQDPVFAPIDGADCPNHPRNHSLLLRKGLFRIFLPMPDNAEFTLSVVSDPTGCNFDPTYARSVDPKTRRTKQMVSVFRRPRISGNLAFVTNTFADTKPPLIPPIDLITGAPLGVDPFTRRFESHNIMWDGREPTLESQANDATLGHAQAKVAPTSAQIAQIVKFENGVFTAQEYDFTAGYLNDGGATGGVFNLSRQAPDQLATAVFDEYRAWGSINGYWGSFQRRQSINRGMQIFNTRQFTISNVSGINNSPVLGKSVAGTCGFCHSQAHAGNTHFPAAQVDMGIGGDQQQFGGPSVAWDLPVFRLTCNPASALFNGAVVTTNDPGMALITGRCADIGRRTPPSLRGVVAHQPFFSDGSANTLDDVVNFYNNRFSIGLSWQDRTDLVNFLQAL